jgi:hypothetical protein
MTLLTGLARLILLIVAISSAAHANPDAAKPGERSLTLSFYWDFCGYMASFPQKNKIAILKFSNFLNPRAADLMC